MLRAHEKLAIIDTEGIGELALVACSKSSDHSRFRNLASTGSRSFGQGLRYKQSDGIVAHDMAIQHVKGVGKPRGVASKG